MTDWLNISRVQVRLTSGQLIVITGREKFRRFMWNRSNQVEKVNITFTPAWDTVFSKYLHHTSSWFPANTEDGNFVWTSMDYNDPNAVGLETAMKAGLAPWTPETLKKIRQHQIRMMSHEDFVNNYC